MANLPDPYRIFISSTWIDLEERRQRVRAALRVSGAIDIAMEDFGARDERPKAAFLEDQMGLTEIETYFSTYVRWMRDDIDREITWASRGRPSGNLLCALGLLVYTEALGRLERANLGSSLQAGTEQPQRNFETMFDRLGGGSYGTWRVAWEQRFSETSVYEVLRSGFVHEYRPKVPGKIHMGLEAKRGVEYVDGKGLEFYVVPYFRDFSIAADELLRDLRVASTPLVVPDPHLKLGPNAIYTGSPVVGVSGSSVASTGDPSWWPEDWRRRAGLK